MRDAFSGVGYDPGDLTATVDDNRDIVQNSNTYPVLELHHW